MQSTLLKQSLLTVTACAVFFVADNADASSNDPTCSDFDAYAAGSAYQGGEVVGHDGGIYRCKDAPYNGWCGQVGYQPGVDLYWDQAWEQTGNCVGAPLPACNEVSAWAEGTAYAALDFVIGDDTAMYQCKGWPFTPFCAQTGFAPGVESSAWNLAWEVADTCEAPLGYPNAADYDSLTICAVDSLPATEVDWPAQGVVIPISNSGGCQASWAAAAIDSITSSIAIQNGTLTSMSVQELIDCDTDSNTCGGAGSPASAMELVSAIGGLCSESEYPYTGERGVCQLASCGTKYNPINGLCRGPVGDELALEQLVASGQIPTVVIPTGVWFDYYSSGIAQPSECGTNYRAAAVVGFGEEAGLAYWKLKIDNGPGWGENGFLRIARGQNTCGIADYVAVPSVD